MNAIFVIPNLTHGGVQTQVFLQAQYFVKELKWDVTIVGLNSTEITFIELLDSYSINWIYAEKLGFLLKNYDKNSRFYKLLAWWRMWRLLFRLKPDVLLPCTRRVDKFVNALSRFVGAKVNFSFELGGDVNPRPFKNSFVNRLVKNSNPEYVSNSKQGTGILATKMGVDRSRIRVIKNAFIPRTKFEKDESIEFIHSLSETNVIVLMIANFFAIKNHAMIINGWSYLKTVNNVKLIFAGLGGEDECKQVFSESKSRVTELGLANEIYFLGSTSSIPELLSLADIGLLSSFSEGCPNAVLEYMGASLPVLATDVPGIREVLPLTNYEYLFESDNITDFVKKAEQLIDNKDLRLELGAKNKTHVSSEYAPEKMFEGFMKIFQENRMLS